ncbi:phosphoadenylyl-sulfate reductase [Ancylobacter defluvii]|uniref:Adenosine 5'-phosphosulfate reductase n=1 Tax=Ancylobacter defluvii TaxID=1282440 RepID=A0A9W6JRF8_9HYPH|nr:phosphoadenylyl-sulfate reductase [Ancylobacter defluvii]MBS7586198.1 phosphoadenylyl-sulfate reductase [Ancylobacter defluvii]GLK82396.1 phosphoadenosine phosphosulfate reductase [Ancylobacter defluvii]
MTSPLNLDTILTGLAPLDAVEEIARTLEGRSPTEVIAAAQTIVGRDRLCLVSSFGTESAVLLAFAAEVDPSIPVVFLDTGWLFEETLAYRDTLTAQLGLTDVRSFHPDAERLATQDAGNDLWYSDPDACCRIRKVEPLARALDGFDGWLNGRKRYQASTRAGIPVAERDGERLKFNPLASLERAEVEAAHKRFALPPHPLEAKGFPSVGCLPCTSRVAAGEDARAGRWRGRAKTECGIHTLISAR